MERTKKKKGRKPRVVAFPFIASREWDERGTKEGNEGGMFYPFRQCMQLRAIGN